MMFVKLVILSVATLTAIVPMTSNVNGQSVTKLVTDKKFLSRMLQIEPSVISSLQDYVRNEAEKLKVINKYIENYRTMIEPHLDNLDDFLDHPLNSYQAIKQLSREWSDVSDMMDYQKYTTDELFQYVNDVRQNFETSKYDVYNAGASLHRLQLTYNLSIEDMASGSLKSQEHDRFDYIVPSKSPLLAFDCLQISLAAVDEGYLLEAEKWVEQAEQKIKAGDKSTTGEFVKGQRDIIDEKRQDPANHEVQDFLRTYNSSDLSHYLYNNEEIDTDVENEMFRRLCRNQTIRFPIWESRHRCRYETNNNSFLLLQPLKMEMASSYPRIEIIHDFLRASQIDKVLLHAYKEEAVSSEISDESLGINGVDMMSRSSSHVWLSDNIGNDINEVTKRIELATGLKANDVEFNGEPYQVANYATGGRYQPHPDHFGDFDRLHPSYVEETNSSHLCGDRIATFMIYLNEVGKGGSTVFPDIGISVTPEKGSAVFWWNLNKAGEGDDYTRHGGCPVLYGSKWIMNKWFCFRPQVFNAPCGIKESDYF